MAVDFQNDLIIITAASGKQAEYLPPLLSKQWNTLRLVVNSDSSSQRLSSAYPNADVQVADLAEPQQARQALRDAKVVVHIGPSLHPHETEIGYNTIDAAKSNGVEHFVYSSVLQAQSRELLNHDCKRYVEEALVESGLNFTILEPAHFMNMEPFQVLALKPETEVVYGALWDPSVKFSFLALQDLAEAAAKELEERERHYFSVYPLSSTLPMSYNKVCETVGELLGMNIVTKQVPFEQSVEMLLGRLFGTSGVVDPKTVDVAERLVLYHNRHGLSGNPNVLERLIGRKTTNFGDLAKMTRQSQ